MKFNKARFALTLTLLSTVALCTPALAGGWFSSEAKEVTLEELLRNPTEYKGKQVVFTVYFNEAAEQFNPYYTEFHKDMYGNFTAWPIDARLYEKRDFEHCYPHFYVNVQSAVNHDMKKLERFDVIECTGIVKHIFHGRPHIEIMDVSAVSYGMDSDQIKAAIHADAHFLAGHYDRAEKLYMRAMTDRVPSGVRADLSRRLGDARYGANRYDSARTAYKHAMKDAPQSAVLKRNIAACDQAYARANGDTRAQIEPTKSPAHYLEPVRDDMASGVDAVIAALEDPTKADAEAAQEKIELASRSVHGTNGATVVAVSDTKPVEVVAEMPTEESDGESDEESDEEATEEPAAPSAEAEPAEPATEEPATGEPAKAVEEPMAEEPAAEEPVEVVEEPMAEEATVEEPAAEESATEEPAAVVEQPKAEEPMVEEPAAEEPAEAVEEPAAEEVAEEVITEEPASEETAAEPEAAPEETVKVAEEEPVPAEETVSVDANDESMDELPPEPNAGPEEIAPAAPEESNPRVMKVGDTVTMLPRLPFHGCSGVSYEAYRAVVEEILNTEDPIEVDGFESEIEVARSETAEPEIRIELADEPMPTEEAGDVPTEEQGEPGQSDESVDDPEQPEQTEANDGQESTPAKIDEE